MSLVHTALNCILGQVVLVMCHLLCSVACSSHGQLDLSHLGWFAILDRLGSTRGMDCVVL